MKTLFWFLIALLWSPFEIISYMWTSKVTKIGLFIADKMNS